MLKIRGGIIFEFYPGLPQTMYLLNSWLISSSVCCNSRLATKRVEQGIVLGWLEMGEEATSGVEVGLGAG